MKVTKEIVKKGLKVIRGKDWSWGSQDVFKGNIGSVISDAEYDNINFWVFVEWNKGSKNTYRIGPKDFDLETIEQLEFEF